jgi:hypothetical protein
MSLRSIVRFLPFILALGLTVIPSVPQASSGDFSIVLFPDTQNEAQYYPQVLQSETQWVANNKAALNIQAVLGLGDIVNDGASAAQQQNADAAIRTLDGAGIPYFLAIGNHDYDGANNGARVRNATGFNRWWGPLRYTGKGYYLGQYPTGSNENFYGLLNINGKPLLILVVEYVPRTASLNWAASVVKANPGADVIVVTHSNMFWDNTRVDRCDTNDMVPDNDGDETWEAFTSRYPNIIMVVSGHITTGFAGRRADLGVNDNLVNQMLSNYQTTANGGDGWLRILTFHPAFNTISVKTYSPYLASLGLTAYKTDSKNQFTIYYHNPGLHTGHGTISGLVRQPGSPTCKRLSGLTVSAGGTSTVTDINGNYSLSLPAPNTYTVTASGAGWYSGTQTVRVNDQVLAFSSGTIYGADANFYLSANNPPPCAVSSVSPSVTICTPSPNASVTSPAQIVAGTTDSKPVQFMQVLVDGKKKYQVYANTVNTSLTMNAGPHKITVQGYDGTSTLHQSISVTVH